MIPRRFLTSALLVLTSAVASSGAEMFTHRPLTLFSGPDARFITRATLEPGMPITVLWCNAAADWCMVRSGELQGWAPLDELKVRGAPGDSGGRGSDGSSSDGSVVAEGSAAASLASEAEKASASVAVDHQGVGVSVSAAGISVSAKVR